VWPDTFVEESNLAQNVFALRRASGESGQKYIETVPKLGYRFLASVRIVEDTEDELFVGHLVSARTDTHEADSPGRMRQPDSMSREAAAEDDGAKLNIRALAVLPFKMIGGHDDYEHLELGMADSLIVKLSNVRRLTIRPTSAILRYNSKERDYLAAAHQLDVDVVLDGFIQLFGSHMRVSVQLVS
jgi:TolB-like protein